MSPQDFVDVRVAVLGSVNLDLVARVARLPAPGETVGDAVLARHPGGKGANQALAARRLGAVVALVARVGDDVHAIDHEVAGDRLGETGHAWRLLNLEERELSEGGAHRVVVAPCTAPLAACGPG